MELVQREFSEETESLFYKDAYTPKGCQFEREIVKVLQPVFFQWLADGYSIRELSYLAGRALLDLECEIILDSECKKKTLQQRGRDYINGVEE